MSTQDRIEVYKKILKIYEISDDWLSTILGANRYERNITDGGLCSCFYVLDYRIKQFSEIENYRIAGNLVWYENWWRRGRKKPRIKALKLFIEQAEYQLELESWLKA